jgi:hypothetical protein
MNNSPTSLDSPEENPANSPMPDESRRTVLQKLGKAALVVPIVILITDASTNTAAASV